MLFCSEQCFLRLLCFKALCDVDLCSVCIALSAASLNEAAASNRESHGFVSYLAVFAAENPTLSIWKVAHWGCPACIDRIMPIRATHGRPNRVIVFRTFLCVSALSSHQVGRKVFPSVWLRWLAPIMFSLAKNGLLVAFWVGSQACQGSISLWWCQRRV